jgi:hypothetical protein
MEKSAFRINPPLLIAILVIITAVLFSYHFSSRVIISYEIPVSKGREILVYQIKQKVIRKSQKETVVSWKFLSSKFKGKSKKDYSELIGLTLILRFDSQNNINKIGFSEELLDSIIENYKKRLVEIIIDTNSEPLSSSRMKFLLDKHRQKMNTAEKFNQFWIERLNLKNSGISF